MGFLSKAFKGIGKVFKKIGRGIKKVVGKIGKFMDKIGIVGQIGLSLLLPGVGQVLGGMLNTGLTALAGSSNVILSGAGKFLQGAIKVGTNVGKAFSSITEGVTKVVGETVGTFANELGLGDITKTLTGGKIDIANKNFSNLFERTSEAITNSISGVKEAVGYTVSGETASQLAQSSLETVSSDLTGKLTGAAGDTSLGVESVLQPIEVTAQRIPTAAATETQSLLQPIEVTAKKIPTTTEVTPSFGERFKTAITEAPGKIGDAAIGFVEDLPSRLTGAAQEGVESITKTKLAQAVGIKTTPEYNITNVAGFVPTIDLSGTSDIGTSSQPFNAIEYMANNSDMINMTPYGYSANIYNQATYQNRMREYGYA